MSSRATCRRTRAGARAARASPRRRAGHRRQPVELGVHVVRASCRCGARARARPRRSRRAAAASPRGASCRRRRRRHRRRPRRRAAAAARASSSNSSPSPSSSPRARTGTVVVVGVLAPRRSRRPRSRRRATAARSAPSASRRSRPLEPRLVGRRGAASGAAARRSRAACARSRGSSGMNSHARWRGTPRVQRTKRPTAWRKNSSVVVVVAYTPTRRRGMSTPSETMRTATSHGSLPAREALRCPPRRRVVGGHDARGRAEARAQQRRRCPRACSWSMAITSPPASGCSARTA